MNNPTTSRLPKTFAQAIWDTARGNPNAVFEILLSTGTFLSGKLSPIDEDTDYLRLNPVSNVGSTTFLALSHIVSIKEKVQ